MKRWMILSIFVACMVLIRIDSGIFALPAAFMVCIAVLWNKVLGAARDQLTEYRQGIEKKIRDAEHSLVVAEDFLQSVQKTEKDLIQNMNDILQSAHQEAAVLLKKAQNEVEFLQENQRRQIELQGHVLRQKWRLSMGQEFIESMQNYITSSDLKWPNSSAVLEVVSKKACSALIFSPILPKSHLNEP